MAIRGGGQTLVIARSIIAGAIVFACALLVLGCGGEDDRSAQAIEWEVFRPTSSRQVDLVAAVNYCDGDPKPTLQRPVIEYSGKRVFIELLLEPQGDSDDGGCLPMLLGVHKTIVLKQDLDELVLFDSSTDPPKQRWPRK